jgi:hypothetical protein
LANVGFRNVTGSKMWFILPIFVLGVWCFVEKKVVWNCLLGAKLLQQMDDIPHSDNLLRLCQAFKLASFWLV